MVAELGPHVAWGAQDAERDGGKLKIGPPWDFNLAFGNCVHKSTHVPRRWRFLYTTMVNSGGIRWYSRMMMDSEFSGAVAARWKELRAAHLSDEAAQALLCSSAQAIEEPAQRNYATWQVLGKWVWGCDYIVDPPRTTYMEEVDAFMYFLLQALMTTAGPYDRRQLPDCRRQPCDHRVPQTTARPCDPRTPL
ncbi:hypothetical protein CYMTET_41224 [Cymbomonas tetramitiformis]|uniref:Uncharacterized protein n=1 Tax=Cymbomonas tetramitiformis TaxID=36881 RepID=A0AAE0C7L5_9CHLO|nr:hypothetical protein CYMTET_41224 [Cymbomonas tetramitiformis]